LGGLVLDLLPRKRMEPVRSALTWTLGRVGARTPLYGPLNTVVPAETAAGWLTRLLDNSFGGPMEQLAVMQLARRTDDRYRDVPAEVRDRALEWLRREGAPEHFLSLVKQGGQLDSAEQGLVFGESLPKGLRIE
jgi:hypothetical protein